ATSRATPTSGGASASGRSSRPAPPKPPPNSAWVEVSGQGATERRRKRRSVASAPLRRLRCRGRRGRGGSGGRHHDEGTLPRIHVPVLLARHPLDLGVVLEAPRFLLELAALPLQELEGLALLFGLFSLREQSAGREHEDEQQRDQDHPGDQHPHEDATPLPERGRGRVPCGRRPTRAPLGSPPELPVSHACLPG